ncbi:DUF4897 domain-containing protein [Athalassotoga saccharophila]|uniref:DUF4897 domain-containing protein n=1 Tax=Athalassotoga saccharophila TaxID=1441386 RepID=UPI001379D8EF|nr:DUF4897 domain-containing protein [Athalassotoga saccharophila]BBJ27830.1 hypothetical protein ATHSA_0722 [Athalassotoga saccharophila]
MSKYNKFLWIMVGVLVVVMVVQFVITANRKPPYEQIAYQAEYIFTYSTPVVINDSVKLYYPNSNDLQKALDEYNKLSPQDKFKSYQQMFDNLSKSTKLSLVPISYDSTAIVLNPNTLQFTEHSVVDGIVTVKGSNYYVSMGKVGMKLDKNSVVTFEFPQDSKIISVNPTPTTISNSSLTWEGPMDLSFPEVVFTR